MISAVKNYHNKTKTLSIKELLNILKKPFTHKNEKFIVEGFITKLNDLNPKKIFKKMLRRSKKVYDFDKSVKVPKNEKIRVFMHTSFVLRDAKNTVNIYMTTVDGDYHLFESWGMIPPSDSNNEWSKIKESVLKQFIKEFQKVCDNKNKVKLAVQLRITKKKQAFLQICDTVFLPL